MQLFLRSLNHYSLFLPTCCTGQGVAGAEITGKGADTKGRTACFFAPEVTSPSVGQGSIIRGAEFVASFDVLWHH